jgi:transformation/transcription domain-associated protein
MTCSTIFSSHPLYTDILASLNSEYLGNQNDIVRALRWLWRSRGRHYRLLHEEEIPPRYHCESLVLGKFLVSYSQANEHDTDVLFDLIRIFCECFCFLAKITEITLLTFTHYPAHACLPIH